MNLCPGVTKWQLIGAGLYALGYMVFEFWLGKTEKTKAGSGLELILLGLGAIIGVDLVCRIEKLFSRGKNGN